MSRRPGSVIAWMPRNQRSASLATALGFELRLLGRKGYRRPWTAPIFYPLLALRTIGHLVAARPRAVIVVAPPFVASLVALPVARLLGARVAIDIHSGAFMDRRWQWSVPILVRLGQMSDAAIVTLPSLAARLGASATVVTLPAPWAAVAAEPGAPPPAPRPTAGPTVVAVCGWGDDEPIEALIEAATGEDWRLVITGNPRRQLVLPSNAMTTGYLADAEYLRLLSEASIVVVLTTREETTLSGVWEAVMLGRPLVTSGTRSLRETLGPEITYVDPVPASIRAGVARVLANPAAAEAASQNVARVVRQATHEQLERLRAALVP